MICRLINYLQTCQLLERRQRVQKVHDEVEEAAEEDDGDGRRDENVGLKFRVYYVKI